MQNPLRICICDDEETALQIISGCVENISLKSFTSAKKCVSYLKNNPTDLVFLDINMPEVDGIVMAKQMIAYMQDRVPDFIFVSSNSNRVFDSFAVHPFGFIRKDKFLDDITSVLNRYIKFKLTASEASDVLKIKDKNGITTIYISDIEYIESLRNTQIIHRIEDDSYVLHTTMNEIEERLKESYFIRVHKSFIVNCKRIINFSRDEITLKSGQKIVVGRTCYKDAMQKYLNYIYEHGDIDFGE